MRIIPTQDEINHRKDVWQLICWRMNVHRINPEELSDQTPYSKDLIEKGTGGEPIPLTLDFLRACVRAFNLIGITSGRGNAGGPLDTISYDECINLLKPPSAMPPRQGNFWDEL